MSGARRLVALFIAEPGQDADASGFFAAACKVLDGAPAHVDAVIVGVAAPEQQAMQAQQVQQAQHAQQALRAGAASVSILSHPQLCAPAQVDQLLAVLVPALQGMPADLFLLHADSTGDELAARLAMRLGGTPLGRCTSLECTAAGWLARKSVYGGRMQACIEVPIQATIDGQAGPCFAVLHAASTDETPAQPAGDAAVRRIDLDMPLPGVAHIRHELPAGRRRRVEGARIVVTGGRGMGGPEGFVQLQTLADLLGAALGGSLPTVDAGWVPVSHQVGQSGKYVAPALYVAVGLSGTPQHMAGVAPNTAIIAINKDEEADIFRVARAGAVADWKELLPELIRQLQQG